MRGASNASAHFAPHGRGTRLSTYLASEIDRRFSRFARRFSAIAFQCAKKVRN